MQFRTDDNPPRLQTDDTAFGVVVGSKYESAEVMDYWKFNPKQVVAANWAP